MSLTPSTMLPLGTKMPEFSLPTTVGEVTSEDLKNQKAVVVAFICNHCPYVKHIRSKSMEIVENYEERGVAFVAINSNDAQNYPDDSFENMKEVDEDFGYNFPYAFGLLFGLGLFTRYSNEGATFVPLYDTILRDTGRGTANEVTASAGFDIESIDFWKSGLNQIAGYVDKFVELVDQS